MPQEEVFKALFEVTERKVGSICSSVVARLSKVAPKLLSELYACLMPMDEEAAAAKRRRLDDPATDVDAEGGGASPSTAEARAVDFADYLFCLCASGCVWDESKIVPVTEEFVQALERRGAPEYELDVKKVVAEWCRDLSAWSTRTGELIRDKVLALSCRSLENNTSGAALSYKRAAAVAAVQVMATGAATRVRELLSATCKLPQSQFRAAVPCIWQPYCVPQLLEALALSPAEQEPPVATDWGASCFWELAPQCALYSAKGDRDNHRHGACVYLRVDTLRRRNDAIGELARLFKSWDEAVITFGRNRTIQTKGWSVHNARGKRRRNDERWKVIHAEVDCLCRIAAHPELCSLLAPVAARDWKEYGTKDVIPWPLARLDDAPLDPKILEIAALFQAGEWPDEKDLEYEGPLGVVVVELSNDYLTFDDSQACPLCVKGLKRYGLGAQTYTVSNEAIFRMEKVRKNELLVCESLRAALGQM